MVPSISFPPAELAKITAVGFYEERMLFVLLLLRKPGLRVVFVTSSPVDPATVDYYLRFLPAGARDRLSMVTVDDPSIGSLSAKVLARPDVVAQLRELVPEGSIMLPFNVTPTEAGLAVMQGLSAGMNKAQERLLDPLTTKQRQVFMDMLTRIVEHNNQYGRAALRNM